MEISKENIWFQLAGRNKCYLLDPERTIPNWTYVDSFLPHTAAKICRFGAQTLEFYSLAQHCVGVSNWVGMHGGNISQQLQALLHDAGECFLGGDIPRPVRQLVRGYDELETSFIRRVLHVYNLPEEIDDIVWAADDLLLAIEAEKFLDGGPLENWSHKYLPPDKSRDVVSLDAFGMHFDGGLTAWDPGYSAQVFACKLTNLTAEHFKQKGLCPK